MKEAYDVQPHEGDSRAPESQARARDVTQPSAQAVSGSWLPQSVSEDLSRRWQEVQYTFVDDPRAAVGKAQELVDEALNALTQSFSRERGSLDQNWGSQESTERARLVVQRYRALFQQLLSLRSE
jgi:hypothetical protein